MAVVDGVWLIASAPDFELPNAVTCAKISHLLMHARLP
jgi:hypothetical protein